VIEYELLFDSWSDWISYGAAKKR